MKHRILIVETEIRLFASGSLKDKRQLQQKIVDKLKTSHNISVAVTKQQELWNVIGLTIAYVALEQKAALQKASALEKNICRILEQDGSGEVSCFYTEII
ncbi:MAG: DUF503 family protein [Saccharofermentanales bacterium]|jgi:uncharacterized protein YlxP (DUF503 family)|nr:DUF503 domain-containing protein [Clostridiaceae bacterium]